MKPRVERSWYLLQGWPGDTETKRDPRDPGGLRPDRGWAPEKEAVRVRRNSMYGSVPDSLRSSTLLPPAVSFTARPVAEHSTPDPTEPNVLSARAPLPLISVGNLSSLRLPAGIRIPVFCVSYICGMHAFSLSAKIGLLPLCVPPEQARGRQW